MRAPDQSLVGSVLGGRYRVVRVLAAGGMGAVYEAEQLGLGRAVAVKVMHPLLSDDDDALSRFEREARAVAGLGHPNIVQVFDFHRAAGELAWIAMELVQGVSLGQVLKTSGPMPAERVLAIALPLLSALEVAHDAGVVHRDLKPGNVMITTVPGLGEVPKLVDFGIAKMMEGSGYTRLTRTGAVLGTPQYMAPEQALGAAVDARADLYSVGVIVYAMLTGISPFRGESVGEVLRAVLDWTPPAPSAVRPEVPNGLDAPVMRAMAKEPAARFSSARQMADALRGGLAAGDAHPLGAPVPTRAAAPMPPPAPVALPPASARAVETRDTPLPVTAGGGARSATRAEADGPSRARARRNTGLAVLLGVGSAILVIALTAALLGGAGLYWLGGFVDKDAPPIAAPSTDLAVSAPTVAPLGPGAPTAAPMTPVPVEPAVPIDGTMQQYLANAREVARREAPGFVLFKALGYGIGRDGRISGEVEGGDWMFQFRSADGSRVLNVQYRNPPPRTVLTSTSDTTSEEPLGSPESIPDSDAVLADVMSIPRCRAMDDRRDTSQSIVYLHRPDIGDAVHVMLSSGGTSHSYVARIRDGRLRRERAPCD